MRLLTTLLLTLVAALPSAAASAGGPASLPMVTQIQSQGVRLSLAMPRGPYAWNSFIPVTARVVNVSGQILKIGPTEEGLSCFVNGPAVEVQRPDGTTVFPPSVPNARPLPCPAPPPGYGLPLRPGAAMTWNGYVVLRAAHLLARVTVVQGTQTVAVATPAVIVSPRSVPAPQVTLHTDGALFATLTRPPGARGPMLAAWWWDCVTRATARHSAGEATSRPGAVTPIQGTRLTPHLGGEGCIRLVEWHAVAGWAGFPAASVNYVAPGRTGRRSSATTGQLPVRQRIACVLYWAQGAGSDTCFCVTRSRRAASYAFWYPHPQLRRVPRHESRSVTRS